MKLVEIYRSRVGMLYSQTLSLFIQYLIKGFAGWTVPQRPKTKEVIYLFS